MLLLRLDDYCSEHRGHCHVLILTPNKAFMHWLLTHRALEHPRCIQVQPALGAPLLFHHKWPCWDGGAVPAHSSCLPVPGPGLLSLASPPRGADIQLLSGAAFSPTCLPFLAEGLLPLPALKFMILLRQYRNLRSYFNTHFEGLSLTMARDIPSECSHLLSLFPLYRHYLLFFLLTYSRDFQGPNKRFPF